MRVASASLFQLHLRVQLLLILFHDVRQVRAPAAFAVIIFIVTIVRLLAVTHTNTNTQTQLFKSTYIHTCTHQTHMDGRTHAFGHTQRHGQRSVCMQAPRHACTHTSKHTHTRERFPIEKHIGAEVQKKAKDSSLIMSFLPASPAQSLSGTRQLRVLSGGRVQSLLHLPLPHQSDAGEMNDPALRICPASCPPENMHEKRGK